MQEKIKTMKNIHVLPTDKQSRLHYFTANKAGYYLYPNNELLVPRNPNCINQNIYITYDEEIKDKCYVLCSTSIGALYLDGVINTASMLEEGKWKKIILTTDQQLIKNGVQAIDDEFLEWFVKNPSCESVEVELFPKFNNKLYKIIIPKEEPEQETLEEAAYDYSFNLELLIGEEPDAEKAFIEGAKWQQERMYSETDIVLILSKFRDMKMIAFSEWFEQFKNK